MKDSRWINRFLSSLLAAAMLFALTAGAVPAFAEGEGDPGDRPLLIPLTPKGGKENIWKLN